MYVLKLREFARLFAAIGVCKSGLSSTQKLNTTDTLLLDTDTLLLDLRSRCQRGYRRGPAGVGYGGKLTGSESRDDVFTTYKMTSICASQRYFQAEEDLC